MALARGARGLGEIRERLGPRVDAALVEAAEIALRLESDAVAIEHLLLALLADEDSALFGLVEHAFADPETIAADLLAIAPGILVVAREATMPFSPGALRALRDARRRAHEERAEAVTVARVLVAAHGELPEEARSRLAAAGFTLEPWTAALADEAGAADEAAAVAIEGHLFHSFDDEARRAMSGAARTAHAAGETSISPARLLLACARAGRRPASGSGPSATRLESALAGLTADDEPPPPRDLAPDEELSTFLAALPRAASSLDVLERVLADPAGERAAVFLRQKVGPEALARARKALEARG